MSIRRLWVRISNCSRLSLYLWGERRMVTISFSVGRGMGPETRAPVRLAVSTIVAGALVDEIVLVGLELDADLLICHVIFLLLVCGLYTRPSVSFLKCFSRAHRPVARIVGALRKLPGWHSRQPPAKA